LPGPNASDTPSTSRMIMNIYIKLLKFGLIMI